VGLGSVGTVAFENTQLFSTQDKPKLDIGLEKVSQIEFAISLFALGTDRNKFPSQNVGLLNRDLVDVQLERRDNINTTMSSTPSENGSALPLRPAIRNETEEPMSPRSGPVKGDCPNVHMVTRQ
jgi:hypothetical protein